MILPFASTLALALSAASVSAQTCRQNLLVDDFTTYQRGIIDGADRQINKLGADYGAENVTFTTDTTARTMSMTPLNGGLPNYWFVKYDAPACFDLRGYTHLVFTLRAPAGSTFLITHTQKAPDCVDRGLDSVYIPVTRYTTPNGQFQEVRVPLADFALNINGTAFDFQHLKDLTFVNYEPADGRTTFTIQNMFLAGNCTALPPLPSPSPVGPSQPASNVDNSKSPSPSPSSPVKVSSANSNGLGAWTSLVAGFLSAIML